MAGRSAASGRHVLQIEVFRGVDLNNAPSNVDPSRSPDAPNMIRGVMGKVRKRQGYYLDEGWRLRAYIYGVYSINGIRAVHAGANLIWGTPDAQHSIGGMARTRSRGRTLGGRLCIIDGQRLLFFDGISAVTADSAAYIPTLMVSRLPNGGGTVLEPLNLLGRRWREQFLGDGSSKTYELTAKGLAQDEVWVETLNSNGEWTPVPASDFTVDRANGTVTFVTAPPAPPISGHDNVRITAAKDRPENLRKIMGCTIMELYGVGGSPDRLFLSGNPEYPGMDFYSEMGDPTYFGDTWYSDIGQGGAEIVGYSVVGDALATHTRVKDGKGGIIVRSGILSDGHAAFPVVNTLSGEAAVAPDCFATLGKEPFFLTERGVYSITAEELTGERYSQQRSFYIAPALQAERNPQNACAVVWKDFYVLSLNGKLYLLDSMQKAYQSAEPHSSHQYECYVWTGVDARVMWVEDGQLCFGTSNGRIYRFYEDVQNPASYNDDGAAISARWDTPELSGQAFFRNKTFRNVAVRLQPSPVTSVSILVQRKGLWHTVSETNRKFQYLDWSFTDFRSFSCSADRTPKLMNQRIRVRKTDKSRFRLHNSGLNESFGIDSLALEYSEGGVYK
ncbi:MAG: hypothetical protein LBR85_00160 [Oscillospiraceae bacterium]|jgi:hypothetical protein|nr:hypothetical protein [Oscillospiraceae bacterium]